MKGAIPVIPGRGGQYAPGTAPKRFDFKGTLCVYRESSQVEHLSAKVTLLDARQFHYYRCPKAFDAITSGLDNVCEIAFTADWDGTNPRAVRRISPTDSVFPIVIRLSKALCEELSECEMGAYEDAENAVQMGEENDRPLESHTYIVAKRAKDKHQLVIQNNDEAEDVYYSVCSGTFAGSCTAAFRAACRIANILRPYALSETVKLYPKPTR